MFEEIEEMLDNSNNIYSSLIESEKMKKNIELQAILTKLLYDCYINSGFTKEQAFLLTEKRCTEFKVNYSK